MRCTHHVSLRMGNMLLSTVDQTKSHNLQGVMDDPSYLRRDNEPATYLYGQSSQNIFDTDSPFIATEPSEVGSSLTAEGATLKAKGRSITDEDTFTYDADAKPKVFGAAAGHGLESVAASASKWESRSGVEKSAVGEIVWSHGIGLIITTQKSNRFSQNFCAPRHHMYHHNVPYGVLVITHKRRVTKSGLSQTKVGMCS